MSVPPCGYKVMSWPSAQEETVSSHELTAKPIIIQVCGSNLSLTNACFVVFKLFSLTVLPLFIIHAVTTCRNRSLVQFRK